MSDPEEEKLQVIKAAVDIIVGDFHSQVYSTTEYIPSNNFLKDAESVIAGTLLIFFECVVLKQSGGHLIVRKKCVALCSYFICETRTFICSLLNGVVVYLC